LLGNRKNLIEDEILRDRLYVFRDRRHAGRELAKRLLSYKGKGTVVLGIPSGGVPVAAEIAKLLRIDLDLVIVRKVRIPNNPEAGFGSVGPGGEVFLNATLLSRLHLTEKQIKKEVEKTKEIIKKRENLFRRSKSFPELKDKKVIIADDGLASGYTMLSAIEFVKRRSPQKLIVAVPTASLQTVEMILPQADELFCLNIRSGPFFAVADAYQVWHDLRDAEVISILADLRKNHH